MPTLRSRLLGRVSIEIDNVPLTSIKSQKAIALLCYLVVSGKSYDRHTVATLLWGGAEYKARANLRKALAVLRNSLDPFLLITNTSVGLDPNCNFWVDALALEQAVKGLNHSSEQSRLEEAIALYRGDFLNSFHVRNAFAFDAWQQAQQVRFREKAIVILEQLVELYVEQAQVDQAVEHCKRLLQLDPWHEVGQRRFIKLLEQANKRLEALVHYEQYRDRLNESLGVEPDQETQALYKRLRGNQASKANIESSALISTRKFSTVPPFLEDGAIRPNSNPTKLAAREQELSQLLEYFDRAASGKGLVTFVAGEAGQGKTALLHSFAQRITKQSSIAVSVKGNCNAFDGIGEPYLPFGECLSQLTGDLQQGWIDGSLSRSQIERLWSIFPNVLDILQTEAPALLTTILAPAQLLSRAKAAGLETKQMEARSDNIDDEPEGSPTIHGGTQLQVFNQFTHFLLTLSETLPIVLILDDMQWADLATINLLFHISRRIAHYRILVLVAYRPSDISMQSQDKIHPLDAVVSECLRTFGETSIDLRNSDGQQFVNELLDQAPNTFSPSFRRTLFDMTAGNAFFTTEMLEHMKQNGAIYRDGQNVWHTIEDLDWGMLPAKVEGAIAQRIGRLTTEQQSLLRVASVEGEQFSAEVAARVQGIDERTTIVHLSRDIAQLHRLTVSIGSERLGTQRLSRYRFRHNLIQRHLYNSMDETERMYFHEAVADALEQLYPSRHLDEISVKLAYHFRAAGVFEKATFYFQKAGERSAKRSASNEAIAHFKEALTLRDQLPKSATTPEQTLSILIGLGNSLLIARGYAVDEVAQVYSRAERLCASLGKTQTMYPILSGLWSFYQVRGDSKKAIELGQTLIELAEHADNDLIRLGACASNCLSSFFLAEFKQTRAIAEVGLSVFNNLSDPINQRPIAMDPYVVCVTFRAFALLFEGDFRESKQQLTNATEYARSIADPFNETTSFVYFAIYHQLINAPEAAEGYASQAVQLAEDYGFAHWAGWAAVISGWVSSTRGQLEAGIAQVQDGIALIKQTGSEMATTHYLGIYASTLFAAGKHQEALENLSAAESTVTSGGRFWEPEIYRIKGQILLRNPDQEHDAEILFLKAENVARKQGSRLLELRASTSLCALWGRWNHVERAIAHLSPMMASFEDGLDIHDLVRARHILAQLQGLQQL